MPLEKEPSGARSVETEVEVPGTPEQVWEAIATGSGISSWFVPTTCDQKVGGTTTSEFGPGMASEATITEWRPPRMFAAEAQQEPGRIGTEWHIEARDGGTCIVRVVHRWFAETDEWDDQFEGHMVGWQSFFRILRIYLEHFSGEASSGFALSHFRAAPGDEVWGALTESLGECSQGDSVSTPSGAATVEHSGDDRRTELLLRLERPAGTVHVFPMDLGEQTLLSARAYLYGATADEAADAEERWNRWLEETLPGEPVRPSFDG